MAAFDLDGTLAERFTLARFAQGLVEPSRLVDAVAIAVRRTLSERTREACKEGLLEALLRDRPAEQVRRLGAGFADEVIAHRLDADMVTTLRHHRDRGDDVVMITAALDVYARPIADHLGCDHLISARVEVDAAGRCTGRVIDAGLHGRTKVERLRAWLDGPVRLEAYGNSRDDRELLAYAASTRAEVDRRR